MLALVGIPHRYKGGQGNGAGTEYHDEAGQQQQQQQQRTNRPLSAREPGEAGGRRDAGGRGQGLTLGPPPPFPTTVAGAGEGSAGTEFSEQRGSSSSSSSPSSSPGLSGASPDYFDDEIDG